MLLKVDHYSSLARAVARLDRDSYEVRGAIYDRAQRALVKRLSAADPPHSQADIDMELLAFRDAIRRIEFGDLGPREDDYHETGYPAPAATPSEVAAVTAPSGPREPAKTKPARRSVVGRVVRRATFAAAALGVGMAGYAVMTGEVELPWLTDLVGEIAILAVPEDAVAPQAVIFDDAPTAPNVVKVVGKASWRTRTEAAGPQGERATVMQLDLQVPQRRVAMTMSMRRAPPGDAMSHLIEIRFLREDRQPDADIANIGGLYMTTAGHTRRAALAAQIVTVTPGVFLVGLSGTEYDRELNERYLKELTWLGIPLIYRGDVPGTLAVEKGAEGERVINDALNKWRQ